MKSFKLTVVAFGVLSCFAVQNVAAQSTDSNLNKLETIQLNGQQEVGTVTAKDSKAEEKQADKARFITKAGTGSSKNISKAPEVTLPEGPLGQPAGDVNKLINEAKLAGGVSLDPIQREINMPGLKKDDPTLKPFVLHTRNGVNEIVKLSNTLLNRLATPFKKPVLIDATNITHKIIGSDIYYLPTGNSPIGLFITDAGNTSQTISLTVIPSDIPGQNLIVKLEDLRAIEQLSLVASTPEEAEIMKPKANDYTSFIRSLMTQAVRGQVHGFSTVPMEGGVAQIGGLNVTPEFVFTGSVVDIYRYKIKNTGAEHVDISETAFVREGVKAVSFFPFSSLEPEQESYVFLMADKPNSAGGER